MKLYDINWDTDGEEVGLPTEMEIPEGLEGDEVTDFLSDQTGFCVFDYKVGTYTPADAKKIITHYVHVLLFQHDMSVSRSEKYQRLATEIINRCVNEIIPILSEYTLDVQIQYFVRQTMLYMMLHMMEDQEKSRK